MSPSWGRSPFKALPPTFPSGAREEQPKRFSIWDAVCREERLREERKASEANIGYSNSFTCSLLTDPACLVTVVIDY